MEKQKGILELLKSVFEDIKVKKDKRLYRPTFKRDLEEQRILLKKVNYNVNLDNESFPFIKDNNDFKKNYALTN